jgi:dUTP pyrophosphatase
MIHLHIKRVHDSAKIPTFATAGSACFDLQTVEAGHVAAHGAHDFRTGLVFEVPKGHVMLIFSRSGHGFKHGLRLSNCVGVIDSDYRGEVRVKIHNDKPIGFDFEPGDRIAQAMILPVPEIALHEAFTLTQTDRGAGGFGSTGA